MASELCAFCPRPVDLHDLSTQHQITGWVSGPKKDGLTLRNYTGKVAHRACIQMQVDGVAPDQLELFTEENAPSLVDRPPWESLGRVRENPRRGW